MNKTITIYELLGLVKAGKAPKKIKYRDTIYNYEEFNIGYGKDYFKAEWKIEKGYRHTTNNNSYIYLNIHDYCLNDAVEIIEDNEKLENKKMFKLNKFVPSQEYIMTDKNIDLDNKIEMIRKRFYSNESYMLDIVDKISELVDHINKMEENLDGKE